MRQRFVEKYGKGVFEIENNYIRCTIPFKKEVINQMENKNVDINQKRVIQDRNIDLPIHFSFKELLSRHFDNAIEQSEQSNNKLREYASTLKLRMQSYFNDE